MASAHNPEFTLLTSAESAPIAIPEDLATVLRSVVDAMSQGVAITITPLPDELTTTVAAHELGVSRPTLMKLIADGRLEAHKVGSHTRLMTADVHALRRQRRHEQRRAFDELRRYERSIGIDE
ncbi:hypothetical protein ACH46_15580 [Gordonia phthalatica]|uniref:Helix-turn-helix domain-containing protein n=1 Tax=Gordonia phthalatica TaxID=1136941 RepID=A0A0N9N584_9ACTN|nr:hypothetical protein ACH46_15580 [Gordonia phthalatica]